MLLNQEQILLLLERLKWEPVYEDDRIVLARRRGLGYSPDPKVAQIEGALSIMLEGRLRRSGPGIREGGTG